MVAETVTMRAQILEWVEEQLKGLQQFIVCKGLEHSPEPIIRSVSTALPRRGIMLRVHGR